MNVEFQVVMRLQEDVSELLTWFCRGGLAQLAAGDRRARIAVTVHDGAKTLRAVDIDRGQGPARLAAAVELCQQSGAAVALGVWFDGHPFRDSQGDEILAMIAGGAEGSVTINAPPESFERLAAFAVSFSDRFRCIAGGCWVPFDPPPWSGPRFWVRHLEAPYVPGPLSLFIAPPDANRRLLGDPDAPRRAVGHWTVSDGGGVWQLSSDARGPRGEAAEEWFVILDRLGLLVDRPTSTG